MLLTMAASEERAERIRNLKAGRPDLTWDRVATYCNNVKERSAIEWARTGGISRENCEKLAELFEVDPEWLWSGRDIGTPDLMGALSERDRLAQMERTLDEVRQMLAQLLQQDR